MILFESVLGTIAGFLMAYILIDRICKCIERCHMTHEIAEAVLEDEDNVYRLPHTERCTDDAE